MSARPLLAGFALGLFGAGAALAWHYRKEHDNVLRSTTTLGDNTL